MKTLLTLALILGLLPLTMAQNDSLIIAGNDSAATGRDTSKIRLSDKAQLWILTQDESDGGDNSDADFDLNLDEEEDELEVNKYWAGLEMGVGGFANNQNSLSIPQEYDFLELDYAKSINWSINFWEKSIPLVHERVHLITGMGFEWNNYSFNSNFTTIGTRGDTLFGATDSTRKFDRNRLKTTSLNVPLMLGFNTHDDRNKSFRFAAGIVAGYRFHTALKQKYSFEGDTFKPKVKSDYNLNSLRYSATVRFGYRWLNLYGTYALNTLFEEDKGPELHPFTVGVRLIQL